MPSMGRPIYTIYVQILICFASQNIATCSTLANPIQKLNLVYWQAASITDLEIHEEQKFRTQPLLDINHFFTEPTQLFDSSLKR